MEYTKLDTQQILEMIENRTFKKMIAVKDVPVKAILLTQDIVDKIFAEGGYKTVVIDDEGNPFTETTNNKINVADMLVTNQIAGYENSYIVGSEKFAKLYNATDNKEVFSPIGEERTVYMIPKGTNVSFEAPWGGEMKIRGGGVIVPDEEKFYGINPEEFKATYSEVLF